MKYAARLKRWILPLVPAVTMILILPGVGLANRGNTPPGTTGSPASLGNSCTLCHESAAGSGMVEILGLPALYQADQAYDLTVRVSDPTKVGAGFQISAEDALGNHLGTLLVIDSLNTRFSQLTGDGLNWVGHTADGVADSLTSWISNGNAAEYRLRWQAPPGDMGPITFYAAGIAIDNDFFIAGDLVYVTSVTTTFAFGTTVPALSAPGIVFALLLMAGIAVFRLRRSYG